MEINWNSRGVGVGLPLSWPQVAIHYLGNKIFGHGETEI